MKKEKTYFLGVSLILRISFLSKLTLKVEVHKKREYLGLEVR